MREKKFSRCHADERKNLLVRSAIRCLELEGYAGLSVRKITKEANVSQGMINHHFGSMNALITYTYEVLSKEFLQAVTEVSDSDKTPIEKLDAFFHLNFAAKTLNPMTLKAWLVFWSLIPDSPQMADAYSINDQKVKNLLIKLLIEVSEEHNLTIDDLPNISENLMALLDGLWVRECLGGVNNTAKDASENASEHALKIARDWVKLFLGGVFSS